MSARVTVDRFSAAHHGAKPQGSGYWVFYLRDRDGHHVETYFRGAWKAARNHALAYARQHGAQSADLQP